MSAMLSSAEGAPVTLGPTRSSDPGPHEGDPRKDSGMLEDSYGIQPDRAHYNSATGHRINRDIMAGRATKTLIVQSQLASFLFSSSKAARPSMAQILQCRELQKGKDLHDRLCQARYVSCKLSVDIPLTDQDQSQAGYRKVIAEEIADVETLRGLYSNSDRSDGATLRLFHVQNHPEACDFLLKKFNIKSTDSVVDTSFGNYIKHRRPQRKGGRPVLNAKTWPTVHDPWRGTARTAFSLDYTKLYPVTEGDARGAAPQGRKGKLLEINCYDEHDNPKYGFDACIQRLSCYIQYREPVTEIPDMAGIENPYDKRNAHGKGEYIPRLKDPDNGNCIIIFENSESGSIFDTLIAARQDWESHWRRLPFVLAADSRDVSTDALMALECTRTIMSDLWRVVIENWEAFMDIASNHISILEDRIYDVPADESRAPELWANAQFNLKTERLIALHINVVNNIQTQLNEFRTGKTESNWIERAPENVQRISNLIQQDLVKRLANLNDLLYKSVEIRDSRHSLSLNLSLWRLSWITFNFLPLTFLSSFFGMNTDTFKRNPETKWYFAAAVPMMLLVLCGWYVFKHFLASQRQTPYSRGIYEGFFHDLAVAYPLLWSRVGPRKNTIKPRGFLERMKWWLILSWNDSKRTIYAGSSNGSAYDDLGVWSRFKRQLTRKWTAHLQSSNEYEIDEAAMALRDTSSNEVTELAQGARGVQAARHSTNVVGNGVAGHPRPNTNTRYGQLEQMVDFSQRPGSKGTIATAAATGGWRNSSMMVEEERPTWLFEYAGQYRLDAMPDGGQRDSFEQPLSRKQGVEEDQ